jgi:hypothetical protein
MVLLVLKFGFLKVIQNLFNSGLRRFPPSSCFPSSQPLYPRRGKGGQEEGSPSLLPFPPEEGLLLAEGRRGGRAFSPPFGKGCFSPFLSFPSPAFKKGEGRLLRLSLQRKAASPAGAPLPEGGRKGCFSRPLSRRAGYPALQELSRRKKGRPRFLPEGGRKRGLLRRESFAPPHSKGKRKPKGQKR